jgi:hypothetical protein
MPRTDRLGITVSLVVTGLLLAILAPLPSYDLPLLVLGSDLNLRFSGRVQLAILIVGLVWTGVDAIVRTHPLVPGRSIPYRFTFLVLPTVLTMAGLAVLTALSWWGYQIAIILATAAALTVAIVCEYRTIDPQDPRHRPARLLLNAAVYLAALVVLAAIYTSRLRSVLSATGVLGTTFLLALELLRVEGNQTARTWLYAGVTGIVMAELTWALNYCAIDARVGGAALLLAFYGVTGLAQQHLWGRLTRRVVIEFGVVCLVGLLLVTGYHAWLPGE